MNTTTNTTPLPIIRGSTTTILIELYKNKMDLGSILSTDPILRLAVKVDAETAQMEKYLNPLHQLNQISEAIAVNLDKLGRSKMTFSLRDTYAQQYQPLAGETVKLNNQQRLLADEYAGLVKEQHNQVKQLLAQLSENMVSAPSAKRALLLLENEMMQSSRKAINHSEARKAVQKRLGDLYHDTYIALPAGERPPQIPTPTAEETYQPPTLG